MTRLYIEKYLSDYLDNLLDEATRNQVDRHLKTCPRCRARLESLKGVMDQLAGMPKIEAPPDFLDKLHAKIDAESTIKRIGKALFMPFRIKIPLQLVTAAALGLLIFVIISPIQKDPLLRRQVLNEEIMTKAPMVSEPAFNREKLAVQAGKDQADEAALREGASEKPMGAALPQGMKAGPAKQETRRPEPALITLRLKPKEKKSAVHAPAAADQAAGIEDKDEVTRQMQTYAASDSALPAKSMEAAAMPEEPARPVEDLLQRIERMVGEVNGRVVFVAKDAQGRPASIQIEISADQYDRFIVRLRAYGDYPTPPPKTGLLKNQSVLVTIELIP